MRVLHAIWDGGGNVSPQLAIARTLVERGHDVTLLGNRCQRECVEATGAAFRAYGHAPDNDSSNPETDILRDWEARTPPGAFARVRDRLMYGPARLFARDVLEALDESPADVVAWDYLLLGTGLGAERAGVSSAAVVHTVYPLPTDGVPPFGLGLMPARGALGRARDALLASIFRRMFAPGLSALNEARAELGLEPFSTPFDQLAGADLVLVLTSPAFDFAGPAALPSNVRYPGPVLDPGPPGSWDSPWRADDPRPLVLASFSTTYMDQQDLARITVEALAGLPVRALVTTGPAIDATRLSAADNVEVRQRVPHAAVLPEADLVITHAGMGTVHAALAAGVPLVCMPGGRDQNDVAARVVFHGAGIRTGRGASAAKLRRIVSQALADHSLRDAAERMASAFAGHDGAARAADELERLGGSAGQLE
jgi:UDP:flavonoid glycosyltransferase YjiC (YdhE family)